MIKSLGARSVVGIDNSRTMIDIASSKKGRDVEFKLADGNQLPFSDASFDLVFSYFTFHHFQDIDAPIKEVSEVLKPGGSLLVAQTTFDQKSDDVATIKLGSGSDSVRVQVYPQTDDEVRSALTAAGFSIISYDEVSNPESVVDPASPQSATLKKQTVIYQAVKS